MSDEVDELDQDEPEDGPDEPGDDVSDEEDGAVDYAPEDDELDSDAEDDADRGDPPPRRIGARAAARSAVEQVAEMTGRSPEGVTSVARHEEGWSVEIEVVEARRIPDSADVLAVYQTELDLDAELISYRRVRRYNRGTGSEA